ncbi:MAG: aminotransferase class I/II-fold pyridoxal phosphate-dependent enzyme [Cyanobacteria bacterium P01_C01_bin.72]
MIDDFLETPLLDALHQSAQREHAAFYAPGHKQGRGVSQNIKRLLGDRLFSADLPELPELDNLFAPEGAISAAQKLAAQTFGASQTWFLINGSSCGIVAAILATCGAGEKIILPRNIHQSAIAGLILAAAIPIFIDPEYDPAIGLAYNVTPEAVGVALREHPDSKAVMMLHPTYQGICSDLRAIAEITHSYDIPLLVDEAHGAHFSFHSDLPPSALSVGADLTVQSTHKTLSSLTQSSMLHIQGNRVSIPKISRALQLVQSTSPNYLLLASLDAARQQMAAEGYKLMNQAIAISNTAKTEIAKIPRLAVLDLEMQPGAEYLDPTRLTIDVSQLGITGFEADAILHEQYGVTCELPLLQHLTFIISLGNSAADIEQLIHACKSLAQLTQSTSKLSPPASIPLFPYSSSLISHPLKVSPRVAYFTPTETVPLNEAGDRLCGELICPYPPGIPLLMPGEIITVEAIKYLKQLVVAGGTITGCNDPTLATIQALK